MSVISAVQAHQCAPGPEPRAYLLSLVRFGDARMRDDFGCINFAGGEVSHLVAFSKPTLERIKTLTLTCCVFGLSCTSIKKLLEMKLALPFPKLSHGSSTSPWQGQWWSWPSPRAHCAHPTSFCEARSTFAWLHTCCCCLSVGDRCFSVLPFEVVSRPALRMQPGARLWGFIVWHPPHPAPLSAALSLTSQCEIRAWGLPDIDCLAWVLMMAQTWNQRD